MRVLMRVCEGGGGGVSGSGSRSGGVTLTPPPPPAPRARGPEDDAVLSEIEDLSEPMELEDLSEPMAPMEREDEDDELRHIRQDFQARKEAILAEHRALHAQDVIETVKMVEAEAALEASKA